MTGCSAVLSHKSCNLRLLGAIADAGDEGSGYFRLEERTKRLPQGPSSMMDAQGFDSCQARV